jgi:phage gp36-like protein
MPYLTQQDIETAIPPQHLRDALDDDGDGQADDGLLDAILAAASADVDSFLVGRFAVPFVGSVPNPVKSSAFTFACERVYDRRHLGAENPWTKRADAWRERLAKMATGELPLDVSQTSAFSPGAVISEGASIDGSMR